MNHFENGPFRIFLNCKKILIDVSSWIFDFFLTCRVKSWTMLFSETCDPIAKRLFNCFSMRVIISWSSSEVKPSAPVELRRFDRFIQWKISPFTETLTSQTSGCSGIQSWHLKDSQCFVNVRFCGERLQLHFSQGFGNSDDGFQLTKTERRNLDFEITERTLDFNTIFIIISWPLLYVRKSDNAWS